MKRRRRARRPRDRAIGYVRASTAKQVLTEDAQIEAIERYAAENGIELVGVYHDAATSGSTELADRPGWSSMVEAIARYDAGLVLVVTRSRVAREVYLAALADREIDQAGAELVDLETAHLGGSPAAQLTRDMLDAVHAQERRMISRRTRRIMESLRGKGARYTRHPPYGFRWAGGQLEVVPEEQDAIRALRRWRARGHSIRRCVELLDERGHPPRGERWHATTVQRLLARLRRDQ